MTPGLLVRLRPLGPWRPGSDSGALDSVDPVYHSDSLYSAVCGAMLALGEMERWLSVTALSKNPAVRFTSAFPFHGNTLYVPTPRSAPLPASSRIRPKSARFVPVEAASRILAGQSLGGEQWELDALSGCIRQRVAGDSPNGPFRETVRCTAAVDRVTNGQVLPLKTAAIEFAPGAGLWIFLAFADEAARSTWRIPLSAAFRLLADSGFGGRRSIGWGRSAEPEMEEANLEDLIPARTPSTVVPDPAVPSEPPSSAEPGRPAFWLLSLLCPGPDDSIDWAAGRYSLLTRGGYVESSASSGAPKKLLRMVAEGSVVSAATPPHGSAVSVAPDSFPHPVYRYGFPVTLPITEEALR